MMASASSSHESDRAAVEHEQATERVRASLTHEESELFAFLRATCEHHCPEVVCRVAGGWVRDKILGVTSKDVDVALNMSGLVFAQHVNEELASSGLSAKRIGLIAAHPDKGKNLETVTMHLFDHMSVDFTNLRAPDGEIGCPRQDAFRRDLTINSLFYNINSGQVEDWTGFGLADLLQNRLIRTPIPPLKTFYDDPLRVVRAVRFAERYRFELAEELVEAAKSEQIRARLEIVSRERFGVEVSAMFRGRDPAMGVRLLLELGLFVMVFLNNQPVVHETPVTQALQARCLRSLSLFSQLALPSLLPEQAPAHLQATIFAALMLPLHLIADRPRLQLLETHVRPSLYLSNHETKDSIALLRHHAPFYTAAALIDQQDPASFRSSTGMALRELGPELWRDALRLAMVRTAMELPDPLQAVPLFERLLRKIDAEQLLTAFSLKPLFTGAPLFSLLGISPGPQVAHIMQEQIRWLLERPSNPSNPEACADFLIRSFKQG